MIWNYKQILQEYIPPCDLWACSGGRGRCVCVCVCVCGNIWVRLLTGGRSGRRLFINKFVCVSVTREYCREKLVNVLPIHARCVKEITCRKNILCRTLIFLTYIVWCWLIHLNGYWKHLWHAYINVRLFVTWLYVCQNIFLWGSIH